MKKLTILVVAIIMLGASVNSFAQQLQSSNVPHTIKYQAVARDGKGDVIANQNVSFRISIVQGNENGATVYEETQNATTNQFGLANLSIGNGSIVIGNFADIQWGTANYYAKIEFDPKGGTDYVLMGVSQMMSVPYALYAEKSNSVDNFPVKAALQGSDVATPLTNPETGMLVYNTDSAGSGQNKVVPGYYYNAGTPVSPIWVLLGEKRNKINNVTPNTGTDNTTYGGSVQDAVQGNSVSAPTGSYNTGFGFDAFGAGTNPSGDRNTGVGYEAMSNITSGQYNTAVGFAANQAVASSSYNSVVGYEALLNNTASNNTAVGAEAMEANTSGTSNVATGYFASRTNTTASCNTSVGFEALYNNTASFNTAVGDSALAANTSGSLAAALGFQALAQNTTGSSNTAMGYRSLYSNVTGSYNAGFGFASLSANTGSNNTGLGYYSLYYNNTGGYNTAAGQGSAYNITTGSYNTAMGYHALGTNQTGSNNIAIGYLADVNGSAQNYSVAIGANAIVNNSNSMVLGGTGSSYEFVGIGTASPTACLDIADAGASGSNCHIKSEGTAPAITITTQNGVTAVALATGSTDTKGSMSVTTGSNNGTGYTVVKITYNKTYNTGKVPVVLITPANLAAASCSYYVSYTTGNADFEINFEGLNDAPSFNYFVIE